MTKALVTIVALLLYAAVFQSHAQEVRFGFYGGYGSYSLENLKALQDEIGGNPQLPVLSKTAAFPGYYTFSGFVSVDMLDFSEIAADISYQYTGARSYYADYSGYYRLSMQLKGLRSGLQYRVPVISGEAWGTHFAVGGGLTSSRYDIDERFEITTVYEYQEAMTFVSLNLYGEAALTAYYRLNDRIRMEMLFGYEYNIPSRLRWSENRKAYLQNEKREPVRVDWSGVRLRIGASYRILK